MMVIIIIINFMNIKEKIFNFNIIYYIIREL